MEKSVGRRCYLGERLAREAGRYSGTYRGGECWAIISSLGRRLSVALQPDIGSALSCELYLGLM